MKKTKTGTIVCLLLLACSCSRQREPITLNGTAQGTYYSILYYDDQQRDLQKEVDSLLREFDLTASLWEEESLVRRINRNETDTLNSILADMLKKSLEMCAYTEGCFDCRVGKLVQSWGFSFKEKEELSKEQIDNLLHYARGAVGIDTQSDGTMLIRKEYPETELDFNAIAQGYSVDLIGEMFEQMGINNYLIDIGGEVIARGAKSDGRLWCVGIERPAENKYSEREVEAAVNLKDESVVTSGNYRKYYEKDGVRYSHTIDPATGFPVQHSLLSASVVDKNAWRADALATAMMVMGKEKSLEFAKKHREDAAMQKMYFIYDNAGEYETFATEGFKELMKASE